MGGDFMKVKLMKQIPMFDPIEIYNAKGLVATIDPADADLAEWRWQISPSGYAFRITRGKNSLMHRVILSRMLQKELRRIDQVDHIDGDKLNNRRSNLRLATPSQNKYNSKRSIRNTSGYKGVSWSKSHKSWRATIKINGRTTYLGRFKNPVDAHKAYCEAAVKHFGEFARFE